ncbi:MAG: WYL domain-containing protein [Oscillospiraceae bacterium]|nr:WYL domain-containing protein [Oscillospiraceae bacterium]
MGSFSELIKNFDKTRDYIRDFFIYGFKVRNEFTGKSSRTYDDEKRRAESWLGDIFRYDNTRRGKQVSITVDCGHIDENPLYSAYYSKSFTDNDIKLHFMLMDILEGRTLGVREITESLNSAYGQLFDEQTVRNKLKEYVSEGIILCEKKGRSDIFTLSSDTAESFFSQYKGLDSAVKFFSESPEFGIAGNSILKTAGLKNDIFLNKHNYIVHTLEDTVLLDLLNIMVEKRQAVITNFGRGGKATENEGVPLKIYSSSQTGRRYAVMYLPKYKRFNSFRLDYIKSVLPLGVYGDYDDIAEKLCRCEEKCFGVSFGERSGEGAGGIFRMVLRINEETEGFVLERLEREKRCGRVRKIGNDLFEYTVEVFDVNEMMSWVKTFIGRIVSAESSNKQITDKLYRDIARMKRIYSRKEE